MTPYRRRKLIKTFCFLLLATVIVLHSQFALGVEWISIGNDISGNEWSYDTESVRVLPKGIIKAWWKVKYSDEGKNLYIRQLNLLGWESEKAELYETLDYSLKLIEMNCMKRETRLMVVSNYSANHVLDSVNTKQLGMVEWDTIIEKSMSEALYKTVCPLTGEN